MEHVGIASVIKNLKEKIDVQHYTTERTNKLYDLIFFLLKCGVELHLCDCLI